MGLPLGDAARAETVTIPGAVATEPRSGKGTKPEDAIADFLGAWLIEQKPDVAVGYIAPRAFSCVELEQGVPVDRGVARFQIATGMAKVNERIGNVSRLSDAISGVALTGERGKEIPQAHRDAKRPRAAHRQRDRKRASSRP